jgi:hypothetical protein
MHFQQLTLYFIILKLKSYGKLNYRYYLLQTILYLVYCIFGIADKYL